MIASCIQDNVTALLQGVELLSGLPADAYTRRAPECFNSSAGGHLRHIIEHYTSFLDAVDRGEGLDYEARDRDPIVENDSGRASARMEEIAGRLRRLSGDEALRVRSECERAADGPVWCASSVLRELEFLLSHTVHHYALIAVVCRLGGQEVPKDFGMAPSTLRHLRAQASSCAR